MPTVKSNAMVISHVLGECTCMCTDKTRTYADYLKRQRAMEESRWFIVPEFCKGSHEGFFRGWHLYLRQRLDGSRNDDGDWGCIRYPEHCAFLQQLLTEIGAPQFHTGYGLADWFAAVFPDGIEVRPDRVPHPSQVILAAPLPARQPVLPFFI